MENWQFALRAALRDNCVSLETSAAQAPDQEEENQPLMMMSTVQDLWKLLTVSASNRKQWAKAAEFTCGQWPRAWTLRKLWLPTECKDRDIMQKKHKRKCWKNAAGIKSTDGMTDGQAGRQTHKRQLLHVSEKESEREVRETKTKGINETVLQIFPLPRTKHFGFLNALKLVKNTNCCQ